MTPLLDVRAIVTGYGGMGVLSDLSFQVSAGERLAILGRNGIGKTTLLRAVMGLQRLEAGSMTFDGVDLAYVPAHRRASLGIGYVPQGRRLFSRLTVEENLAVGAKSARGSSSERLAAVLRMFPKLAERRKQLAGTLSGGEQQMTAVARALMVGPKLLLLDEPSEGLAPIVVEGLVRDIAEASEEGGFAVIIVEQNLEAALQCTQRALVLDQGRVAADAPSGQLLARSDLAELLSF